MKKTTFAAAALAAGLLAGCAAAPAATTGPAALPACESEDYAGPVACHWDAVKHGNGAGLSFTWDGAGLISYDAPGLNAALDRCGEVFPVGTDQDLYDTCYADKLDRAAAGEAL